MIKYPFFDDFTVDLSTQGYPYNIIIVSTDTVSVSVVQQVLAYALRSMYGTVKCILPCYCVSFCTELQT